MEGYQNLNFRKLSDHIDESCQIFTILIQPTFKLYNYKIVAQMHQIPHHCLVIVPVCQLYSAYNWKIPLLFGEFRRIINPV